MREILFRGKQIDNGEWVYGYYVPVCFGRFPCRPAIVPEPDGEWEPIEVKSETIGQYTGLTTKGKKIFEGDIIKTCGQHSCFDKVEFLDELAGFYAINDDIHIPAELAILNKNFIEVVGNVHDNPDLLKGK